MIWDYREMYWMFDKYRKIVFQFCLNAYKNYSFFEMVTKRAKRRLLNEVKKAIAILKAPQGSTMKKNENRLYFEQIKFNSTNICNVVITLISPKNKFLFLVCLGVFVAFPFHLSGYKFKTRQFMQRCQFASFVPKTTWLSSYNRPPL